MDSNVSKKLLDRHLVEGELRPGREIALRIEQTLTQDATGTLVMLALEALDLDRVRTEVSAQYVDHNLIQQDHRNADDHLFLQSACERFGLWFGRPGAGVSHPVHMECFGRPGASLLGADSHTCAAGAIGMLAFGAGGVEVAMAMAGEPYRLPMPEILGIELAGELPPWVSAKDVVLEVLRRHGVSGGVGRILEYFGPGVATLSAWDRHVIANMGAELGATTTVFPSDERTRAFLEEVGRPEAFEALAADPGASYDHVDRVDLSALEPLIARPSSPGNVVAVSEVAGTPIYQAYLGSSANPGYRDFAVPALMVRGRTVAPGVSFDVNPTSRSLLLELAKTGLLADLISAGARVHQAGCNGCIGMGQAPASGRNSVRTVPRNFPGRSGTREDSVWLASPETVAASALCGVLTDPRTLDLELPEVPRARVPRPAMAEPLPRERALRVALVKGPNISALPALEPLPDELDLEVLLVVGDDLSTDEILPAGSRVLPLRSNIEAIARFSFEGVDADYPRRADLAGDHAVVAGRNYGQGSSREHAALAPRTLGLRLVLARSFARIHRQNLIDFGVLPLILDEPPRLQPGDRLRLRDLHEALQRGREVRIGDLVARHDLSEREIGVLIAGGAVNRFRRGSAPR